MIYLLDLNYTLVANSYEKITPFHKQIEAERYREDLIDALEPHVVILVTARPIKYAEQTLQSLEDKTGWLPYYWFFNDLKLSPPLLKESVLTRKIFTQFGENPSHYLAIESNPSTCQMYAKYAIKSMNYKSFLKEWRNKHAFENS